jgi:hypothetical protein
MQKLSDGEKIISSLSASGKKFYGTDKHLLAFKSETDYKIFDYDKLSINLKKTSRRDLIIVLGVVLMMYLILVIGYEITLFLRIMTQWRFGGGFGGFAGMELYLYIVGIVSIAIVIMILTLGYYQINYPDFSTADIKKWQITKYPWSRKIKRFVEVVQAKAKGTSS